MKLITLDNAPDYDPEHLVAQPFLDGKQLNARVIRLSPGQVLPPHTHGVSELMLYAAEGEGLLESDHGPVRFRTGCLVLLSGDEELRISNPGDIGLTLLAFLAPPFPPPTDT